MGIVATPNSIDVPTVSLQQHQCHIDVVG